MVAKLKLKGISFGLHILLGPPPPPNY